jgi:hypothetical protein
VVGSQQGRQHSVVDLCVEQGPTDAVAREDVGVDVGQALDEAMEAQAAGAPPIPMAPGSLNSQERRVRPRETDPTAQVPDSRP